MDVVDKIYSGYGEGAPRGKGPDQGRIAGRRQRVPDQGIPEARLHQGGDDREVGTASRTRREDESGACFLLVSLSSADDGHACLTPLSCRDRSPRSRCRRRPQRRSVRGARSARDRGGIVIRALQPAARRVDVRLVADRRAAPMRRRAEHGLFELTLLPRRRRSRLPPARHLRRRPRRSRSTIPTATAACSPTSICTCSAKGTHYRAFEKLGAHRIAVGTTTGVHFAVWAPNAERVSVVGDFNGWDGRVHPMRLLVPSGVWEMFIPDLPDGERYKFEIRTHGRRSC